MGVVSFYYKKEYGGKRMKLKKVLSMALSLAMIMSIVPGNVFAADLDADVAVEDFSDDVTVGGGRECSVRRI